MIYIYIYTITVYLFYINYLLILYIYIYIFIKVINFNDRLSSKMAKQKNRSEKVVRSKNNTQKKSNPFEVYVYISPPHYLVYCG